MKILATVLLLAVLTTTAGAQITITGSDFLDWFGTTQVTSTSYTSTDLTGLPALVNKMGPSQTWDFGNRTYTMETSTTSMTVFAYPGNAPLSDDPDFTTATHVMQLPVQTAGDPTIYMFVKLNSEGEWILGMTQDSAGVKSKIMSYSPGYQVMKFPLTYQTSWSSTSDVHIIGIPPGTTFQYTSEGFVDAYGTLVLPTTAHRKDATPTSSADCLRLKRTVTTTISVSGFGFSSKSYTFEWITLGGNSASIGTDSTLKPQSVSYSNGGSSGVSVGASDDALSIHVGANPANVESSITLNVDQPSQVRVAVMDALGRETRVLSNGFQGAGAMSVPFDVTALANGTYFVRVECGARTAMQKIIVSH